MVATPCRVTSMAESKALLPALMKAVCPLVTQIFPMWSSSTEVLLRTSRRPLPHPLSLQLPHPPSRMYLQASWHQCITDRSSLTPMGVVLSMTEGTPELQCCLMLSQSLERIWSFGGKGDSQHPFLIPNLIILFLSQSLLVINLRTYHLTTPCPPLP